MTLAEIFSANPKAIAIRQDGQGGSTRVRATRFGPLVLEHRRAGERDWEPYVMWPRDMAAGDWAMVTTYRPLPGLPEAA